MPVPTVDSVPFNSLHSGRGYQDDGPFFGPFLAKKKKKWPLKVLNLASPGPPGTYFDPLYPAKIDLVPGQPKNDPADLIFGPIIIFLVIFGTLRPTFSSFLGPKMTPGPL